MKIIFTTIIILLLFTRSATADMKIIESGKVLKSKNYSINEATLVISKSEKIYICSIQDRLTQCILSKTNKREIN
jgi:alpha-amylase/alpha-mannosidase (GH57 family)